MSENENQQEQIEESRPTLTLNDLRLMTQIIESGLSRSAWKVDELSTVGGLYDRVSTFLNVATKAQAQQAQASTPASEQD
jgi:hypothetical protein